MVRCLRWRLISVLSNGVLYINRCVTIFSLLRQPASPSRVGENPDERIMSNRGLAYIVRTLFHTIIRTRLYESLCAHCL